MLTNSATNSYASVGDAEPLDKVNKNSVDKSNGFMSRSRNFASSEEPKEQEPNELIRGYVKQIRDKRRELKNG